MEKENGNFEEFTNLYELSKTLRFELKPEKISEELKNKAQTKDFSREESNILLEQLKKIQNDFKKLFVYSFEKNENREYIKIDFRKKIEIKYGWLRNYTKIDFYEFAKEELQRINEKLKEKGLRENKIENLPKQYELVAVDYLKKYFLEWTNEWEELCKKLESFLEKPEEIQERKREFAFVIREFSKRNTFEFIREFIKSIHSTNIVEIDNAVIDFKKHITETEENLKNCEEAFLSSQSAGLNIAKASFNYYTLNKAPKEYTIDISNKQKELSKSYYFKSFEINLSNKFFSDETKQLSLYELYKKVKKWKADQKSKFNEEVNQQKLTTQNFRKKFPLFNATDDDFKEFLNLTEQIKKLGDSKNQSNNKVEKEEINKRLKKLRKQRGYFFNSPDNRDEYNKQIILTKNYYDLCELYKGIALRQGQITATIKGLEYEKVDSQRLEYWSLILKENNRHSIIMVPRGSDDNHKKAKGFVEENFREGTERSILYYFKSLTLRALWKLCFKEYQNTFFPEVARELQLFGKELRDLKIEGKQHKLPASFYQKVLKTKVAINSLDIIDFGGLQDILDKTYEKLEDFESDLEKVCYIKKPLSITQEQKERFIADYKASVFEISSYDLRIDQENRTENKDHKDKPHTKKWINFWSPENKENNYPIRLNPEISIFWREADEKLKERIESGKIKESKKLKNFRNRFSKEQFTLTTNVTFNATKRKSNLAFKTTKDISSHVQEFNDNFNDKFNREWFYGIDRGLKELATLCIVKFTDEKYRISDEDEGLNKPEFAKIEVSELKYPTEKRMLKSKYDETEREMEVGRNISYFIDQENLFEKRMVSCIDLTMAKLIKGKIVLNGDRITYLKLKEVSAKRRLWKLFSHSKIDKNSEMKIGKGIFIIDKDEKKHQFYWLNREQKENQKKKEDLKESFRDYLEYLSNVNAEEDIESIEKINHLRDAITANILGIIAFLQKQFPGIITLENMGAKEHIEKHFNQSNENISRRMEWALYRKFQTEGLVPPQIKQSIFIREAFKEHQFGIVDFVKIDYTSKNCPRCENTYKKKGDHYICEKAECGFSSKDNRLEFEPLDNSDKVAAYNIAKNAFNKIHS